MAIRQYIGARYVPKFYENSQNTSEWQAGVIYEPLTIVTYNGNSYTSKKNVPANVGNPSANPSYWVATGNYNEQINELQNRVSLIDDEIIDINDSVTTLEERTNWYTPEMYGATGDGTTDDSAAFQAMFDDIPTNSHIVISGQYYKIDSPLILNKQNTKVFALGRSDYNPALKTSVANTPTLKVTAPGCSFYHMEIQGTDDVAQTAIGFEFDTDNATWNGNVDAFLFDCSVFKALKGVVMRGRNLQISHCSMSTLTTAIVLEQTETDTDNRGIVVSNNRFHVCNIVLQNNINNSRTRRNIIIADNFCDITCVLFNGYSGNVVIKNNVVHAEHQTGGGFITISAGLYANTNSRDIIQGNCLYGGDNTTNGIMISGIVYCDIKGNEIMSTKAHGIICTSGANIVIMNNILNHCAYVTENTNPITCVANTAGYITNNVILNGGSISNGGCTAAYNLPA